MYPIKTLAVAIVAAAMFTGCAITEAPSTKHITKHQPVGKPHFLYEIFGTQDGAHRANYIPGTYKFDLSPYIYVGEPSEGLIFAVKKFTTYEEGFLAGYLDLQGNVVHEFNFGLMTSVDPRHHDFYNGLAMVSKYNPRAYADHVKLSGDPLTDRIGLIDTRGNFVVPYDKYYLGARNIKAGVYYFYRNEIGRGADKGPYVDFYDLNGKFIKAIRDDNPELLRAELERFKRQNSGK